jgi:ketosteroid isomerase-like protein
MKFPHPLSRRAFVILVLISCISCSSNRATKLSQPGVVGESEIVGVAQTWIARYNAGDAAGVARLYEENGYYASAHILAHGREAIERYWARGIAAGGHIDFIRPVEVRVEGDFGYLLGKYQATNAGKTVDGRIIIIAKRDKGGWMIAVHETVVRDQPE